MKAAPWLISCDLLSLVSYKSQAHLPKDGTAHSGLGLPTTIISQEKTLTGPSA